MRLIVISLIVLGFAAGQAESPSAAIFAKIRQNVLLQLRKTANYICVQTSERTSYVPEEIVQDGCDHRMKHPDKRQEQMRDRLRLDVAISGGNEIYEWHGAKQFTAETLEDIVQSGAVTSGGFNGFLWNIFGAKGVQISYKGLSKGRHAFDYLVPLSVSTYQTRVHGKLATISFHGSFTADPASFELESLTVEVDEFPAGSNICHAATDIHYQMAKIAQKELLIPKEFELRMTGDTHEESVSASRMSECHEYAGESTLKLDYADENASHAAEAPTKALTLPSQLRFRVRLKQTIDSDTAFAGDAVEGVLSHPLKVAATKSVIPAGATVTGVITQIERYQIPRPYFLVGFRFNRIFAGDTIYEFSGMQDAALDQSGTLNFIYARRVPGEVIARFTRKGQCTFAVLTSHLKLDTRYSVSLVTQIDDGPVERGPR